MSNLLIHKDSMAISLTVKSLVTKHMNADPRKNGHQTSQEKHLSKVRIITRIIIQGIVVVIIKSMDTLLRII